MRASPGPAATSEDRAAVEPPGRLGSPPPGVMTARRLTARAAQLARDHRNRLDRRIPLARLAERIEVAAAALAAAHRELAGSAPGVDDVSPGASWILDNHYLAREQARDVLLGLSRAHYRRLPRLADGPYAGAPRIYELVYELVRDLDHAVGESDLTTLVRAYQEVSPLALGELWAIPAALRVVLVERLAALASSEAAAHRERLEAVSWARRIAAASGEDPAEGVMAAGRMFAERDVLSDAFVSELAARLRPRGGAVRPVLEWVDRRLERRERTIEAILRQETQRHASLANAFRSLRWASTARWGRWVERVSVIERTLRLDPLHVYPVMDFETRDRYRRRIETLARGSGLAESDVAERARRAARHGGSPASADEAARHVGYHLIGPGRDAFEASLGYTPAARERLQRFLRRHPGPCFFGIVAAGATGLAALLLRLAAGAGAAGGVLVLLAAAAILPLLDVAIALANRLFAHLLPPAHLPKLSRDRGISDDERTLVAVPTLLTSPRGARESVERLETLALANPEPNLRFALLTDFADAPQREMPGDGDTLEAAVDAIRSLNARHADEGGDRFFLLHRERLWSETERCWMGWERKRGKLEELNALLRAPAANGSFTTVEGDFLAAAGGDGIRYVITLDADTRMPPLAAVDLVRTAAHPLNRPRYDPELGRVTAGYGILQPRVAVEASRAPRTPFAAIMSDSVGLDPYAHAVSDVYQDLFGHGIYTGKGLYDVDAFRRALDGVIPGGAVLSHDLLEGAVARTGLATDITFFDEYPSHYLSWARRQHRWVRGDWQILPWLRLRIRLADGRRSRNPLSGLARWQILDNVRRSLTPLGHLTLLIAGWLALPGAAAWWTALALVLLAVPPQLGVTTAVLDRSPYATWRRRIGRASAELAENAIRSALVLVLLAHQALYQLDAAGRAVVRMVTRRRLLEWTTAHAVEAQSSGRLAEYVGFMRPAAAVGLGTAIAAGVLAPPALALALPFAALWIASPWLAWRLSRAPGREARRLDEEEVHRLRALGRQTWIYFEDTWGAEHGWLPPDNVQLDPPRGVAARTSPTNIGLALVAAQAAHDFGWLTRDPFLERVERTLDAVEALEKHRGHLYNWYETRTGTRMWPPYVSTADSGNLAASLLVLEGGLEEISREGSPTPALLEGLADAARAASAATGLAAVGVVADDLVSRLPGAPPGDAAEAWIGLLRALEPFADKLARSARGEAGPGNPEAPPAPEAASDGTASDAPSGTASDAPSDTAIDAMYETVAERLASAPLRSIRARLAELGRRPDAASARAARLAARCRRLVEEMDFGFLYAPRRGLLAIGYNVEARRRDPGVYDLLASEARLASLIAVAKGDVPIEHWFRLGRPVIEVGRRATLLSWGGTLFEYLMPLLFTPPFRPTLLADSYAGAVAWQRRYGSRRGLPWGVSESQYAAVNAQLDYRYQSFGVPGLGFRRGLADDDVVAPYASALALMVQPRPAAENLRALEQLGALGAYGFFEAVDFTPSRLRPGRRCIVVRTVMAHHSGMILGALSNALLEGRTQELFRRSPRIRSSELLLQERVPTRGVTAVPHPIEVDPAPASAPPAVEVVDHVPWPDRERRAPRGQFLSNGRLATFFHQDGTGSVAFEGDALIRSDPAETRFPLGLFFYVRDLDSGRVWSAAPAPVAGAPDRLEAWFHPNKVEVARVEDWIETFLEIVVSPEDDVDVRRLTITNYARRPRRLEVTSYAEVVLDDPRADRAHPAFSKLFVRTERRRGHDALIATRRPREAGAPEIWLVHALACDRARLPDPVTFETDRARFIGRGRGLEAPRALAPDGELSGTEGWVLDPIVSLRKPVTLGPGDKVQMAFCLGAARGARAVLRLADLYESPTAPERAIELATTAATLERQRLGIDGERIQAFQQLGSAVHLGDPGLRAPAELRARSRGAQPDLWRHGISGDLPIVLVRLESSGQLEAAAWFQAAFTYWRRKGLEVDLVFLNEHGPSYVDELQHALERLAETAEGDRGPGRGAIHLLRADRLSEEERLLLLAVARAAIDGGVPDLPLRRGPRLLPPSTATSRTPPRSAETRPGPRPPPPPESPPPSVEGLFLFNGFGGFDVEAREYVIGLGPDPATRPPAPWINVMANPGFGALVSEAGSSTSWSLNSRQRRLSPWFNDPVRDPTGEALYVRDDEAGLVWSPSGGPAGGTVGVEVRHGLGYSTFRTELSDLRQEVTVHVDAADPVKVLRLRVENVSGRPRSLSIFFYLEWVLGVSRADAAPHLVTALDEGARLALARNRYDDEFRGRVAFVAAAYEGAGFQATCDRGAFLGSGLDPRDPEALRREAPLDGRDGAGVDPCAALGLGLHLEPGEEAVTHFFVGDAADEAEVRRLAERIRRPGAADRSLRAARGFWHGLADRISVRTPAPELDALLNGWLPYQTLSCRLWGRTALYQPGGAFGFRDQLQDAMALVYARPDLTRAQILLHAAHQFLEGDVLHWWHPPGGRGVRTRITDDLLWLPYAVSFYVRTTGDRAVLEETVPYLEADPLDEDEREAYVDPRPSGRSGDIYDHCCRAIDRSLRFGAHGLPLIGTGDWNDGMNRVGAEGRGESVWLGFFLVAVIDRFLPSVRARGDRRRAARYREARRDLVVALEEAGWDGAWYRRGYFDDGSPLGSAENEECRIDAIAQAWAVLSGVAATERGTAALEAVERRLVDPEGRLLALLDPPFDRSAPDPGYIRSYPPGVRENGGQYTHGALWVVMALARMGRGNRAVELLRMMAPPNHARSEEEVRTFRNEPYVVTADVYSVPPHVGRGGWSWYTGSAGWMYRVALESILGFRLEEGAAFRLSPCVAADWPGFRIRYTAPDGRARYTFEVENPDGVQTGISEAEVDGVVRRVGEVSVRIPLAADGREHRVRLRMGSPRMSPSGRPLRGR